MSTHKRKRDASSSKGIRDSDMFDKFIQKCKEIDTSDDMRKILSNKILKLYGRCDEEYKTSPLFYSQVEENYNKLLRHPHDVYVFISYLREEMMKAVPASPARKKSKVETSSASSTLALKNEVNVRRLSKALEKINQKIKELETQEVSWESEEENDSTYIQLQRFKERAVKIHEKLCSFTKESKFAGRIKDIHFSGTPFPIVNRCIEKYVNSTGQFPDYKDILDVVQRANTENNMKLCDDEVNDIAKNAFRQVGKELQILRQRSDAESVLMLVEEHSGDPADHDPELQKKLNENKIHWNKISEIINDFASKQDKSSDHDSDTDDDEEEEEEEDKEEDRSLVDEINEDLSSDTNSDESGSEPVSEDKQISGQDNDSKELMDNNVECKETQEVEPVCNELLQNGNISNGTVLNGTNSNEKEELKSQPLVTSMDVPDNEKTDLCNSKSSLDGKKLEAEVIPNDSCDDIVILDDSGDESADQEKFKDLPLIKSETLDEDVPKGKIKVKSLTSMI